MSRNVLLTGANGFVASHILSNLLDRGFIVCCAVRSQSKGDKISRDFFSQKSQIHISIVPDIIVTGAYDEVLKTSNIAFDTVIHTASPFGSGNGQSNVDFLDPAINGTLNLLRAVKSYAPSVKRIVYTSSCATVIDYDNLTSDPPRLYSENDWNPISWEEAVNGDQSKAYRASKKFAEQAAWKFMEDEKPHFDLVTLCPPATFGPLRHSLSSIKDLNESNARLWKLCLASTKDAPMPYIPVHTYVDVRDLATAQVQAMLTPAASNQRFIVCARQFSFQDICDILRAHFPKQLNDRTPLGTPGSSSLPPGAYDVDNSKVRSVLEVTFRPLDETVVDVTGQLLEIEKAEKAGVSG